MKKLLALLILSFSFISLAHEGGHGAIAEGGKFGGIMAPVIEKAHALHAKHAKVYYKAELVRAENETLSLYFFDTNMKILDLATFPEKVEAKLEVKKKGKFTYFGTIDLKKNGNHFKGQLPKIEYKPFSIDLFFKKGKDNLFAGFMNLD